MMPIITIPHSVKAGTAVATGCTVTEAVPTLPMPPLVEVTALVVLVKSPNAAPVTLTVIVQLLPAATVPPVSDTLPVPDTAVTVPPQVLFRPLGVAITVPLGSVSVNDTPVSAAVLTAGLVMVKVSVVASFSAIAVGLNALLIVGGATTVMLAVAVPPVTVWKVSTPVLNVAEMLPVTLFLVPPLVAATFTANEQEEDAGRFSADTLMVLLPGLAVIEAPLVLTQLPVKPFGDATTRPLGSTSVNDVLNNSVLEFGLVMVNVSEVLSPPPTAAAPKALTSVGGTATAPAVTVRPAVLLVAPAPLSLAEIGPVLLFRVPVTPGVTRKEMKHTPSAIACACTGWDRLEPGSNPTAGLMPPPVRVIEVDPGTAVTVPPQLLLRLGEAATARPAGNASVNVIPVRVTSLFGGVELLFGFWMVKLNNVVPFWATVSGRKSLLMVGGNATNRVADAAPPVPPFVLLTGPVLFRYEPVKGLVTFAVTVQELLVGIVPPVSDWLPEPADAVAVPPQLLVSPLGVATTRFAGKLSVNATPWRGTALAAGLVIVTVSVLMPLG